MTSKVAVYCSVEHNPVGVQFSHLVSAPLFTDNIKLLFCILLVPSLMSYIKPLCGLTIYVYDKYVFNILKSRLWQSSQGFNNLYKQGEFLEADNTWGRELWVWEIWDWEAHWNSEGDNCKDSRSQEHRRGWRKPKPVEWIGIEQAPIQSEPCSYRVL